MSTFSNLKIEEITLGDSGWGTTTTNNLLAIQQSLQSATFATGDFTANVSTPPWTNTTATTNTPRAMVLNITATLSGAGTINLPAISGGKPYLVINNSVGGYAVTVKVTGLTGVSVPNGKAMWLWNNGTDIVDGVNYITALALGTALPVSSGGTGQTTANAAFNALAPSQASANGKYLKSDGTNTSWDALDLSTSDITGTLPIMNGGTGQTTANAAFNALAPSQATASGKYLKSDGANTSWDALDIGTADITGTLSPANGGTGVANNAASTVTITGAYSLAWTLSGATALTLPTSGTVATLAGAETLTNKRINPRVTYTTSSSSISPDVSTYDQYCLTAQAVSLTINAPTGTPVNGNKLIFRILDNGVSQTISWNGTYTAIGVSLPTATTAGKMTYVGCIYNAENTRWDVIAVTTQA